MILNTIDRIFLIGAIVGNVHNSSALNFDENIMPVVWLVIAI